MEIKGFEYTTFFIYNFYYTKMPAHYEIHKEIE